jgi:hypothetical protein
MENDQVNNFTNRELNLSYWYVTHRIILRQAFVTVMSLVCFLFFAFLAWQLAFFGIEYGNESFQLRKIIFADNLALPAIESNKPASLQISDPVLLQGENGRNDYFAQVANGNAGWLATFDYRFDDGSGDIRYRKGFALPQSQKFLMDLGVENRVNNLDIVDVKWQRLEQPDRNYDERYRFTIANEDFIAGAQPGDLNRLIFDITNHSAYGYWEVGIQSFLHSVDGIASINYLSIDQLEAGETRHVELSWSNRLPRINNLEIIPEINVFDDTNIMPQQADPDIPIF